MEPILYYGAPHGCAFGTIVALEWLCRPYRLLRLELPGQPTPMLQTGGRVLRDCREILRHLASRKRHLLGYRSGTPEHERLERLLDTLHEEFQAGETRMAALCAQLDRELAGREWLDGSKRTIADACLLAAVRWAERHAGLRLSDFPRLRQYVAEQHGDPAVYFADAIETCRPAVTSGRFLGHLRLEEVELPLAA
jgi:glutathione S-transferase